ncbi:hypothetical protein ACFPJ1_02280 [Kribbella qitaiheensis]|uniref:hypothetical protein n=1 Tax=Kribbella qitaiheensis TaxID=1544730 RepID=UPI003605E560
MFTEVLAKIHLACDERDERDGALAAGGLDQFRELLRLLAEPLVVPNEEGQPEHQLVQEQDHRLVAKALGVLRDRGEALVERDIARSAADAEGVLEVDRHQGRDQLLASVAARGGRASRVVPVLVPAAGAVEHLAPRIVTAAAGECIETFEEGVIAHPRSQPLGVRQQAVAGVDGRQDATRVQCADLLDVAAEDPVLDGIGIEEVVREPEDLLAREVVVVARKDRGEFFLRARDRVVTE